MSVLGLSQQSEDGYDRYLTGKVVDNNDPEMLQRVRVVIPRLFSDDVPVDLLPWIGPRNRSFFGIGDNYGTISIPVIGSRVAVYLQNGQAEYGLVDHDLINTQFTLPEEFQTNYPNRVGLKTPTGDVFYYEVNTGQWFFRHNKGTSIRVDADGNVFKSVAGNYTEYVKGNYTRVVEGDNIETVKGNSTLSYGSTVLSVKGSYGVTVSSDFSNLVSGSTTTSTSSWTHSGLLKSSDDIIAVSTSLMNHQHEYDDAGNPNITNIPNA